MNRSIIRNMFSGKCAYCGKELGNTFHIDHIDQIYRGVEDKPNRAGEDKHYNLFPACARCNLRKSVLTIEQFRDETAAQITRLRRDSTAFRLAEDFGQIASTSEPVVFWFERFSQPESDKCDECNGTGAVLSGEKEEHEEGWRDAEGPCEVCNGTGQFYEGNSGLESDGNAPVLEKCPSCGYEDAVPTILRQPWMEPWAKWIAFDADGECHQYDIEPSYDSPPEIYGEWLNNGDCFSRCIDMDHKFPGDWRTSKHRIVDSGPADFDTETQS